MKAWLRDRHFRSVVKNTSYLAISRGVATVAGLASLALAGRALGVLEFGVLILVSSYARAAADLSKFQTWQLVVRYGGPALAQGEHDDFRVATGFALALDLASGVLGMIAAAALLPFIGYSLGIHHVNIWMALLYCTALPTMAAATPTGVLRALDRFDLISWADTATPISRAVLAMGAFLIHAPLGGFVFAWYVTDLGGDLFLWFLAWRGLRRRGLLTGTRPTFRPKNLSRAWRFAIYTNLTTSVAAAWGPIARLLVGGFLGATGAALFRVASAISGQTAKPAQLLAKVFYPEVMRMDLKSPEPWRLMRRSSAIAAAVAFAGLIILIPFGRLFISTIFGPEFAGAYIPLVILMIVPLISAISFPLEPMLYALDRPDSPLRARLIGTATFFGTIAPLSWVYDLAGAAASLVLGTTVTTSILIVDLMRQARRIRSPA